MAIIEVPHGSTEGGELEVFDTFAEPVKQVDDIEIVVGGIYTARHATTVPGTWQPLGRGKWQYEGLIPIEETD